MISQAKGFLLGTAAVPFGADDRPDSRQANHTTSLLYQSPVSEAFLAERRIRSSPITIMSPLNGGAGLTGKSGRKRAKAWDASAKETSMGTAARFMFTAANTFIEVLASSSNRAANCHCDESSLALSGAGIFARNLPTWAGLPSRPRGAEPFGLPEELSPVIQSCSHSDIRKRDAKVPNISMSMRICRQSEAPFRS